MAQRAQRPRREQDTGVSRDLEKWVPRTRLGRRVMSGEIKTIREVFESGEPIREPEIVDALVPNLKEELILIGGHSGKGGGIRRTPIRVTTKMHKSGRRRSLHAMVVVGNEDGLVGVGYARGQDARTAIQKAAKRARLNIMMIRRGCGSWECECGGYHSIPFKVEGKCGSVRIRMLPAPKGLGLAAASEIKKIFRLAGIKDLWTKAYGNTRARINFVYAVFDAFEKLNKMKVDEKVARQVGLIEGPTTEEPSRFAMASQEREEAAATVSAGEPGEENAETA